MFGNNWIAKESPVPGQPPPGSRKINFALSTLWAGLGGDTETTGQFHGVMPQHSAKVQ